MFKDHAMNSKQIIRTIFSLPEGNQDQQQEIQFKDFRRALHSSTIEIPHSDVSALYRTVNLNPSSSTNPTVDDAIKSFKDQIEKYEPLFNIMNQCKIVSASTLKDVLQIYNDSTREDQLKHKLFITNLLETTMQLSDSLKSVLSEMQESDKQQRAKSLDTANESWFQILDHFSNSDLQVFVPFMKGTCHSLNVIISQYAAARVGYSAPYPSMVMSLVAQSGSMSCLKFLAGFGKKITESTLEYAALSGNVELVKYIHGTGLTVPWMAVKNAGLSGNFDCFKYVLDHVVEAPPHIQIETYVGYVLDGGDIESIKYAIETGKLDVNFAGEQKQLICPHSHAHEIIQTMLDLGAPVEQWRRDTEWTLYACNAANFSCLKWLVDNGFAVHEECAACAGSSECVKYLWDLGFKNPQLIENAAFVGNLDLLKFGLEVCGYSLTGSDAARLALLRGFADCLEYLLQKECPCDPERMWQTAGSDGTRTTIQLLFDYNVPFHTRFFTECVPKTDRRDLALWVAQKGVPLCEDICNLAARAGLLELLKLGHKAGKPFGDEISSFAAQGGSTECLLYVLENGATLAESAMSWAANHNDVPMLAILLDRDCPVPDEIRMCFAYSGSVQAGKYFDEFFEKKKGAVSKQ